MKTVISLDRFCLDTLQVGDVVAAEVIDYLRNNQSPALDWFSLFQAGGAVCTRLVPAPTKTIRCCNSYTTFARISDNAWEYRGCCLRGESRERGCIAPWERRDPKSEKQNKKEIS